MDLPSNANLDVANVTNYLQAFSFTDGHQTLTQNTLSLDPAFFISTNAAGEITAWNIGMVIGPTEKEIFSKSESGAAIDVAALDDFKRGDVENNPGKWTQLPAGGLAGPPVTPGQTTQGGGLVAHPVIIVDPNGESLVTGVPRAELRQLEIAILGAADGIGAKDVLVPEVVMGPVSGSGDRLGGVGPLPGRRGVAASQKAVASRYVDFDGDGEEDLLLRFDLTSPIFDVLRSGAADAVYLEGFSRSKGRASRLLHFYSTALLYEPDPTSSGSICPNGRAARGDQAELLGWSCLWSDSITNPVDLGAVAASINASGVLPSGTHVPSDAAVIVTARGAQGGDKTTNCKVAIDGEICCSGIAASPGVARTAHSLTDIPPLYFYAGEAGDPELDRWRIV